jgi:hypothetical protein
VDLDNGYDAFAIDNGFTTWSDQPGRDAQQTDAGALRISWQLGFAELLSITGLARSDLRYGFDADWGNPAYWAPYVYQFSQAFERERDTVNQELRLISGPDSRLFGADWVTGVYLLELDESNARRDQGVCDVATCGYELLLDTSASSDYSATSVALFGSVARPLGDTVTASAGLRWEQRSARYRDAFGSRFDPRDSMLGGELGLTHEVQPGATVWARMARGYKAGGLTSFRISTWMPATSSSTPNTCGITRSACGSRRRLRTGNWHSTSSCSSVMIRRSRCRRSCDSAIRPPTSS